MQLAQSAHHILRLLAPLAFPEQREGHGLATPWPMSNGYWEELK